MTGEMTDPPSGTILCVIPGPTKELARERIGIRWCFACRDWLPHDAVLLDDEEPSYYEPIWIRECSRCRRDRTEFPS